MLRPILAALILLATAADAGSLTVNPIRLELGATQAATSMTVGNAGDAPTTVQVSAYQWRHEDGGDQLEPATGADVPIITPPMFRLVPGGSQIVRIGFAGHGSNNQEGRWRLIVEEVPQPQPPQAVPGATMPLQIATRLRVSLPLFRLPAVARSVLDWQLADDGSALAVANHGTTTERIDRARLSASGGTLASIAGPVYLFPGEARRYPLSALATGATARLNVQGSVPVDDHALAPPAE